MCEATKAGVEVASSNQLTDVEKVEQVGINVL